MKDMAGEAVFVFITQHQIQIASTLACVGEMMSDFHSIIFCSNFKVSVGICVWDARLTVLLEARNW